MLQRVQSLFLLAASALMLMIFIWPLASYYSENIAVVVNVYQVKTLASQQGSISVNAVLTGFLSILAFGCAAISIFTIFKFRDRLFQIKLARIAVITNIIFIVIVFALTDFIRKKTGVAPDYGTSIFFPVVALLFQILAMKFIKKDEDLVKSSDRLR